MPDLIKVDATKAYILMVPDVNDAMQKRNGASALEQAIKLTGNYSIEAQNEIAEARIRLERYIGEQIPKQIETGRSKKGSHRVTLSDLGIDKMQSSRFQKEATVPEAAFEEHVATVKDKGHELTSASVLKLADRLEPYEHVTPPPLPVGEYSVILADPPWKYDFAAKSNIRIESHYPTMEIGEIAALQVPAADNAVLFLWATSPKLVEALQVMHCWDFKYKTHMVWDKELKTSKSMGFWFRGQHELLLVGVKGSFSPPKDDVRRTSVLREKKTTHSRKPEAVYEMIESYFPRYFEGEQLLAVELFSRVKRKGWCSWGFTV